MKIKTYSDYEKHWVYNCEQYTCMNDCYGSSMLHVFTSVRIRSLPIWSPELQLPIMLPVQFFFFFFFFFFFVI